jgi:hypothetical protein
MRNTYGILSRKFSIKKSLPFYDIHGFYINNSSSQGKLIYLIFNEISILSILIKIPAQNGPFQPDVER